MNPETRVQYVRDLLPLTAVKCQRTWTLVDYFGHCKGEKTRSKKPCEDLVGEYECKHFQMDFDPRHQGGRLRGTAKIRTRVEVT